MVFCRRMVNTGEERLLGLEAQEQVGLKTRIWVESKLIWRIAFPSMLARVTSFGMYVVTQLFVGHVNELDLAAYAIVQSILARFVNGILVSCFLSILFYFLSTFSVSRNINSSSNENFLFFCQPYLFLE